MKIALDKYEPVEGDRYGCGDGYGGGCGLCDSIEELANTVCEQFVGDAYDLDDAACLPDELVVYRLLRTHRDVQEDVRVLTDETLELIAEHLYDEWGSEEEGDDDEKACAEAVRDEIWQAVHSAVTAYAGKVYVPALYLELPSGWWVGPLTAAIAAAEAEDAARRAQP
jgi:hypothetical protein